MLLETTAKQISTDHLGGLSAILHQEVNLVIWKRRLTAEIQSEMNLLAAGGAKADFITLATDPTERIRHQLGKAKIRSPFLTHDLSLLITAFGELTTLNRVRVRLGPVNDFPGLEHPARSHRLRLCCSYAGPGVQLPGSQPAMRDRALKESGVSHRDRHGVFSKSTLRISSVGQVVLWKNSCAITPLPGLAGSLFFCLEPAG